MSKLQNLKNILIYNGRPIEHSPIKSDFKDYHIDNYHTNHYSLIIYKPRSRSWQLRGTTQDADIFLEWFTSSIGIDDIDDFLSIESNFVLGSPNKYKAYPYEMKVDVGYPSIYDGFKATFFISEDKLDFVLNLLID